MKEPTYRQHKILEEIQKYGYFLRTGEEDDIEMLWELSRGGYLRSFAQLAGRYDWKFILTEKAEQYLKSIITKP